jgi:glutathione S-transferase
MRGTKDSHRNTGIDMIQVFGDTRSGNCLKVKWLLDHLGLPHAWTQLDVTRGETRTARFLALNPAGQVPLVVLPDGRPLAQSNAILLHFAAGTALLPNDAYEQAKVLEWLFWEQYSHEPYVAVRRFHKLYLGRPDADLDPKLLERGNQALARMEEHLRGSAWLVGNQPTVADLCLLPYTKLAHEGGFVPDDHPAVQAWVARASTRFGVGAA